MSQIKESYDSQRAGHDANGYFSTTTGIKTPTLWLGTSGAETNDGDKIQSLSDATKVGAAPTVAGLACTIERVGSFVRLDFTFTALEITVTDAAGSGSSGSVKIFDFVQAAISPLASRQDYTAFAEGAALTGAAGDAAFVIALGSAAANAGDGALTGTEVDIAPATSTITLSGGTGTGGKMGGITAAPIDGTTTATDIYLNWSGSAATIDANSTIAVTGTATVVLAMLGDD